MKGCICFPESYQGCVRSKSLPSSIQKDLSNLVAVPHAGGVRFSESDLELLALAEYVKELEAALDKQRALSASQQPTTPGRTAPSESSNCELRMKTFVLQSFQSTH
jgi:hypothetical protein